MTYGKANRPSRYLRTHPYRKEPTGSQRTDEELTIRDVWNALGTVKKYVVNSVCYFVQKLTGVASKSESKDGSTTLARINGDAMSDNTKVSTGRQRIEGSESDPRRPTWWPPQQQPHTQRQSHPYVDYRPQVLPYRPLNLKRNPTKTYLSPRVVKPYPNRRPWSSTLTPNAPISKLSNSRPKRTINSAYSHRDFNSQLAGKPFRRKLFSWDKYRSNVEFKHDEGNKGEIKVIFRDPSIRRAIELAEQTSGGETGEKNDVTPQQSFAARLNGSARKDNSQKRKTFKGHRRKLEFKGQGGNDIPKGKSGMDLTVSRCNDVNCVPKNWLKSKSDVPIAIEQRNASSSDKIVGNIEVKDEPKPLSSTNIPVSQAKSVQSSSLFDSSKPASSCIFGSDNKKKTSGLCDNVVNKQIFNPASSSTGTAGFPKKVPVKITSSTDISSQSEKKDPEKIISVSPVKAKLTDEQAKPIAKEEKPLEADRKSISNKTAAVPQKPAKSEAKENISFACRMARLKRIKIRDYYIQKIESLYDNKCMEKEKDSKKSKAMLIYRNKYHLLRQDHTFYTKLCEQYNVEPGEEYTGVDPDIKRDDDEEVNENKKTVPVTFSFKPKVDLDPKTDSKPKVDPEPAVNKPHINPFAVDTIKPTDDPQKKGFQFSSNIFTTGSTNPPKQKLEDSSKTNLFSLPQKPNLFSGQSISAPAVTNPFSPSATAAASRPLSSVFKTNAGDSKNSLFSTTNGAFKPAGGLFGSTSKNGGDAVSMDSDLPTANNTFGSTNLFGSKAQTSNTNLFQSNTTANNSFGMQQGGSSGSGAFGHANPNTNIFATTSSRKRGFGNSGPFNPGNMGQGDAPVFSLGKVGGNAGKKKRRTIVRGRRTLS